jgi:hypothetical protein
MKFKKRFPMTFGPEFIATLSSKPQIRNFIENSLNIRF